ncbi:hypothetical protein U1Q18_015414 [Sarracenia purpurea var. burkii]
MDNCKSFSFHSPMASSHTHLLSLFIFFLISVTSSENSSSPSALVLPLSKHASTLQYTTIINQRTPLVPLKVVVDLAGPFLWVTCGSTYISTTYHPADCRSPTCSLAHASNDCHLSHCLSTRRRLCTTNNTCVAFSQNGFTGKVTAGELSQDILSLQSTNGLYPTSMVSVPRFLFLCAPDILSRGLAAGAAGVAGLGNGLVGLPEQLADAFNFSRKFALCLPPSTTAAGVLFFGDGPYVLLPGIDVSKLLIFTPLSRRPKGMAAGIHVADPWHSYDYYIRVKSIRVNGKKVSLNSSSLLINNKGFGGTKFSTVTPHTILETSIYNSVTKLFIKEALAANATRLPPAPPFDVCFSTKSANGDPMMRPAMPVIDLMLQNKKVFWRIFEPNSMVLVGNETSCLGFLDGGSSPGASITIGGHQIEDNLLQFDLEGMRLGFTSYLLIRETDCASFNFSSSGY